jgi:hypothetical protein
MRLLQGQKPHFCLEPIADDFGALLAIGWPCLREAVVHHIVGRQNQKHAPMSSTVQGGGKPRLVGWPHNAPETTAEESKCRRRYRLRIACSRRPIIVGHPYTWPQPSGCGWGHFFWKTVSWPSQTPVIVHAVT